MARWAGLFIMNTRAEYLPVEDRGAKDALNLAGALVVLASNPKTTYPALCALLTGRKRPRQWHRALSLVPATTAGVDRLTDTIRTYQRMAAGGYFDPLDTTGITQLAAVVEGMVAVQHGPRQYLEAVRDMFYTHPVKVFSPELRARVAGKLRGLFGELAADERQASDLEGLPSVD